MHVPITEDDQTCSERDARVEHVAREHGIVLVQCPPLALGSDFATNLPQRSKAS
jgi:hypothetical protein